MSLPVAWHQIDLPAGGISPDDLDLPSLVTALTGRGLGSGGGGNSSPGLLVRDGVVPLEPVGMDGATDTWLYGDVIDTGTTGGVTDHGALTGLADDDHPQYVKGANGRSYGLLAGVLRKNGGTWFLIDDANHRPLGLGTVTFDSTSVVIQVTLGATYIGSVVIGPDETYAAAGYSAGASVTKTQLTINIGKNGVQQNPSTMPDSSLGNFWIIGLMEVPV